MEILPGIHRIDGARGCNVYMLSDGQGVTLIDTGWPGNAARISRYLEAQGMSVSQVERILITHAHPDHTGTVRALRRLTDVRVMVHPGDLRWDSAGQHRLHYVSQPLALRLDVPFFQRIYADELLEEGMSLPIMGGLTVLHTPGHTAGSVAFYLQSQGVLFTGDTLLSLRGRFARPFPFPGTNLKLYRRSVERLAELDFDVACPGHGRPLLGRAAECLGEMLRHYLWAASGFNRVRSLVGPSLTRSTG